MKSTSTILLVENNRDFIYRLDEAFRQGGIHNPLRVARYGNEAILYLKGVGVYADRTTYPIPALMLIDLAMPDGSGFAVLGWIRQQPAFDLTPIVVLVEDANNPDIQKALDMGANSFLVKQFDIHGLIQLIQSLELWNEAASPQDGPPEPEGTPESPSDKSNDAVPWANSAS